ncbi:MAG: metallophosphoesterase family protein [Candidatus Omnitrophica bacterium]|nr:metallophosphoesterase family protein [Candidatus Omnitrophota bacterium]
MRYGVFSDVHSNLEALEAVLGEMERERVDRLLCAGDLVGYGADPGACLARIRGAGACSVCGNHDCAVIGRLALDWFNENARASLEWTTPRLPGPEKEYLAGLPYTWKDASVTMVHSALDNPKSWRYVLDPAGAEACLSAQETPIAFFGHTHVPGIFLLEEGMARFRRAEQFTLGAGQKALVNVGSVGQPRDGDPRAAYVLYDSDAGRVEIRRVAYPVEKAQRKILEAGLPEFLAARLAIGY